MVGFNCSFNCVQRVYMRVPRILAACHGIRAGAGRRCLSTTPEVVAFDVSLQLSDFCRGVSGFGGFYPLKKLLDHRSAHASELLVSH